MAGSPLALRVSHVCCKAFLHPTLTAWCQGNGLILITEWVRLAGSSRHPPHRPRTRPTPTSARQTTPRHCSAPHSPVRPPVRTARCGRSCPSHRRPCSRHWRQSTSARMKRQLGEGRPRQAVLVRREPAQHSRTPIQRARLGVWPRGCDTPLLAAAVLYLTATHTAGQRQGLLSLDECRSVRRLCRLLDVFGALDVRAADRAPMARTLVCVCCMARA